MYDSLPRDPQAKVQVFTSEILPLEYTEYHCHNGATFFVALQGRFEAHFEKGVLVRAKASDLYSKPSGRVHRGFNPHPSISYLCIGVLMTSPDREHMLELSTEMIAAMKAQSF